MAMQAETQIANSMILNNNAFEIKVVYVKLTGSKPSSKTSIEIAFPPRNYDTLLHVNCMDIIPSDSISVGLNRNRVNRVLNKLVSESIHVSTHRIKALSTSLPFEIRVDQTPLVVGRLRLREGERFWVMECKEGHQVLKGGFHGEEEMVVDVCIAGRSAASGRPVLLNRVVKMESFHECHGRSCDDSKGTTEARTMVKKKDGLSSCHDQPSGEEEEWELSLFNAGVRVGIGHVFRCV